jgi:hypothetical protein
MSVNIQLFEEYGAPVGGRGTAVEVSNLNWKNTADSTIPYHLSPLRRPTKDSDVKWSYKKYCYFKITGSYTKINRPKIEFSPGGGAPGIRVENEVVTCTKGEATELAWANIEFPGSGDTLFIATVGALQGKDSKGNDVVIPGKTLAEADFELDKEKGTIKLKADSLPSTPIEVTVSYTHSTNPATNAALYYKLTNTYEQPDNLFDGEMIHVGTDSDHGGKGILLPLSTSPTIWTPYQEKYLEPNVTLYTPFIVTQLMIKPSKKTDPIEIMNDVGNTTGFNIKFSIVEFS